ncbi:MAG: protein tolB [Candidatus Xenolissoclinum pacificiensis L6]|uniref:Protein tolB n=1 Tax=Candidatus Xenolissoclinum pacificiensis L6 TaxID=1401685 RepID=W2V154_9RICK|nr:MAG: protein tolB [Candidatus Xenolissoclinum pacificiensis L6]
MKYFCIILNVLIFSLLSYNKAHAILKVDITQGNVRPVGITYQVCNGDTKYSSNISNIIKSDLKRTGFYSVMTSNASQCITDIRLNTENVDYLYTLDISHNKYGINLVVKLWDVYAKKLLIDKHLSSDEKSYRDLAHMASDVIYSRLTGDTGYFNTKIVYITEKMNNKKVEKLVTISDQDGENPIFITESDISPLSPRISYDSQKVAFMAYKDDIANIYILDLNDVLNGKPSKNDLLVTFQEGVLSSPRFSPDNKFLLFARSYGVSTDIYKINLETFEHQKLTSNTVAINTSPAYSPDMQQIAFISDRDGTPNIYVMDANGKRQKRITKGPGSYFNTTWSPRGDWIAFTKVHKRKFYIGIIKPDGSSERLLTNSPYVLDTPSWSTNGRLLLFSRKIKQRNDRFINKIYTVDITGHNEMEIKTPYGASDPSWSS